MSGQHRHTRLLARLDEPPGHLDGVTDRFLHDHRDTGGHALQPAIDVHLVGGGEDDAVWLVTLEQLSQRLIERHTVLCCQLRPDRARINDRGQCCVAAGVDFLDMPFPDDAGTSNGEADRTHQMRSFASWYRPLTANVWPHTPEPTMIPLNGWDVGVVPKLLARVDIGPAPCR